MLVARPILEFEEAVEALEAVRIQLCAEHSRGKKLFSPQEIFDETAFAVRDLILSNTCSEFEEICIAIA